MRKRLLRIQFSRDQSSGSYLPRPPNPAMPIPVIPVLGYGDMMRAMYDVNSNGVVDKAEAVDLLDVVGLEAELQDIRSSSSGPEVMLIPAGESLAAGDFVNIYDAGGTKVRLAVSGDPNKTAHGYVLAPFAIGETARIYLKGLNGLLSGLVPGQTYVLDNVRPGKAILASLDSITSGQAFQQVGVAMSATTMSVNIEDPIIRG